MLNTSEVHSNIKRVSFVMQNFIKLQQKWFRRDVTTKSNFTASLKMEDLNI